MTNSFHHISSKDNPKFKQVRLLLESTKHRKKQQATVLEGTHLILSYLANGDNPLYCKPTQIWLAKGAKHHPEVIELLQQLTDTPIFEVSDALYKHLRSIGNGIDVLAVITIPTVTLPTLNTDILILNNVQDTGNVGTLLRTASAVGIKHVICTTHTANVWSPKCLRAGMGAQFSLTIYENVSIDTILKTVATPLLATSSHTKNIIYQQDLTQPSAWIMGNEGQGVDETLLQKATAITLPQKGEESLNVAIAGALCMYEMLRQREHC